MPKRYPSEFRERVLSLVNAGRSVAQVASDLGVSQSAIYKWRDQQLVDSGMKPGLSTTRATGPDTPRNSVTISVGSLPTGDVCPPTG